MAVGLGDRLTGHDSHLPERARPTSDSGSMMQDFISAFRILKIIL